MATFNHIADERFARRILRGGIRATVLTAADQHGKAPRRGVFCVPVVPSFQSTFQWLRELKRQRYGRACGIQFRIDDAETVFVGHYGQSPQAMTATQSVAFFLRSDDPRGLQVIVPRAISAREIMAVRPVRQVVGWRFYPAAKGRSPLWPAKGSINASRLRRRIETQNKHPWET
jgi:hypothetical protein